MYYGKDHQIGVDVSDVDTYSPHATEKILERASMNWPVYQQDGLGESWRYAKRKPRITYRMDQDAEGNPEPVALGIATNRRQVFQNEDVVGSVVAFCRANGVPVTRAGTYNGGADSFMICGINQQFAIGGDDQVEAELLVTHSHDVGSLNFSILTQRLACTNQLVLPNWVQKVSMSHVYSFDTDKAIEAMDSLQAGIHQFQSQAERLASRSIRTDDLSKEEYQTAQSWVVEQLGDPDRALRDQPRYVQELLSGDSDMLAKLVAIKTLYGRGKVADEPQETGLDNLPQAFQEIMSLYHEGPGSEMMSAFNTPWGILNACSHYCTHKTARRGGVTGHFTSLWAGNKARYTQSALKESVAVDQVLG